MVKISKILFSLIFILGLFLWMGWTKDLDLNYLIDKYTDGYSDFIQIEEMSVHYRKVGSGKTTILLLHGTGASLHTWEAWQDILADDFTTISVDLPGFGLTGPHPEGDYSLEAYVQFIDQVSEKLSLDTFIIVGNSLGGGIAWNYAAQFPDKVNALVLLAPSGYPSEDKVQAFDIATTPILKNMVKYITPKSLVEDNLKTAYYNDRLVTEKVVNRYYELLRRQGNRQAFIDRANTQQKPDTTLIKNLQTSVLLLWGEEDSWINPSHARRFMRDLAQDTLVIYSEVGHLPMEEIPLRTATTASDFIQSLR